MAIGTIAGPPPAVVANTTRIERRLCRRRYIATRSYSPKVRIEAGSAGRSFAFTRIEFAARGHEVEDKMKKKPIALALFLALGLSGVAGAADQALPVKAPRPVTVYDWTGFYAGINVGGTVGHNPSDYALATAPTINTVTLAPRGVLGGVQAGYNFQVSNWVLGVEADWQGTTAEDSYCTNCGIDAGGGLRQRLPWFATARGRVGLAQGPLLFYGTAGAAFGRLETNLNCCVGDQVLAVSPSSTLTGWTAGLGIEAALAGNWTAKAEYLHANLGGVTHVVPFAPVFANVLTSNSDIRMHVARVGLNYRFGGTAGTIPDSPWARTHDWNGFYAGLNLGYGAARDPLVQEFVPFPVAGTARGVLSPDGVLGGGQFGFNWQAGRFVAGLEADFQGADQKDSHCRTCPPTPGFGTFVVEHRLPWFATARARLGVAAGPALFYATGGGAYGRVQMDVSQFAPPLSSADRFGYDRGGWTLGGGLEAALAPNWTAKAEYLHVDLGSVAATIVSPVSGTTTYRSDIRNNVFRLGVNYRFGAAAGPVVAKN